MLISRSLHNYLQAWIINIECVCRGAGIEWTERAGIGLDTGLDWDQSNHASPHPAMMAYVVDGDAVTCMVMLFMSWWGHACRQLAADEFCLFNGDGMYVRARYRTTSGCYDTVR